MVDDASIGCYTAIHYTADRVNILAFLDSEGKIQGSNKWKGVPWQHNNAWLTLNKNNSFNNSRGGPSASIHDTMHSACLQPHFSDWVKRHLFIVSSSLAVSKLPSLVTLSAVLAWDCHGNMLIKSRSEEGERRWKEGGRAFLILRWGATSMNSCSCNGNSLK